MAQKVPVFGPPPVRSVFVQFRLTEDFSFWLPWISVRGAFKFGEFLSYRDGKFTAHAPYEWDGNSVKFKLGYFEGGVSDGPLKPDGTPMGKFPSCGHDIIYKYIWEIAKALGLSVWAVRAAVDRWFYERWLIEGQVEEAARVYYNTVRLIGVLPVLRSRCRPRAPVQVLALVAMLLSGCVIYPPIQEYHPPDGPIDIPVPSWTNQAPEVVA